MALYLCRGGDERQLAVEAVRNFEFRRDTIHQAISPDDLCPHRRNGNLGLQQGISHNLNNVGK